jgi:hypothetical protein
MTWTTLLIGRNGFGYRKQNWILSCDILECCIIDAHQKSKYEIIFLIDFFPSLNKNLIITRSTWSRMNLSIMFCKDQSST